MRCSRARAWAWPKGGGKAPQSKVGFLSCQGLFKLINMPEKKRNEAITENSLAVLLQPGMGPHQHPGSPPAPQHRSCAAGHRREGAWTKAGKAQTYTSTWPSTRVCPLGVEIWLRTRRFPGYLEKVALFRHATCPPHSAHLPLHALCASGYLTPLAHLLLPPQHPRALPVDAQSMFVD